MNTAVIATTSYVTAKPFSDTVKALLIFTKQTDVELSLVSLHNCLRDVYHPDMRLKDVIVVLLSAIEELSSIPQFETPSKSFILMKVAAAPLEGTSCLGNAIFGPNRTDVFTVEQFYDSMIKQILYTFRFTNVGWCKDYLFPEKVIA
jgi:hypothetical protein